MSAIAGERLAAGARDRRRSGSRGPAGSEKPNAAASSASRRLVTCIAAARSRLAARQTPITARLPDRALLFDQVLLEHAARRHDIRHAGAARRPRRRPQRPQIDRVGVHDIEIGDVRRRAPSPERGARNTRASDCDSKVPDLHAVDVDRLAVRAPPNRARRRRWSCRRGRHGRARPARDTGHEPTRSCRRTAPPAGTTPRRAAASTCWRSARSRVSRLTPHHATSA